MKKYVLSGAIILALLVADGRVTWGAAVGELERAIGLYNGGEYVHARKLLQNMDVSGLGEQQKATRTDFLARAQRAMSVQTTPAHRSREAHTVNRLHAGSPRAYEETFVQYPPNWSEICRRQERYGAMERMEDPATRQARRKFAAIVPEISFEPAVTFGDAIDRIRQGSGLNVVVNWPALQQFGLTREQEVTLPRLTNIPWRKVTDLILKQISATTGGVAILDWAIEGGILTISTRDDLSTQLTTKVYDIGDLLVPRMVVGQPSVLGLTGSTGSAAAGTAAGFSGGSISGG